MEGILAIDPKEVEKQASIRKYYLTRSHSMYDAVKSHDSSRGSGVLSSEANTAVSSLEVFLGTYDVFKKSVAGKIAGATSTADVRYKEQFVDMFSLYAGAAAAASLISKSGNENEQLPLPGRHGIDFSKGEYLILDDLVKTFMNGVNRSAGGKALVSYANDLYKWVMEEAVKCHASPKIEPMVRQAEASHIQVDGIIIRGFSHSSKSNTPDTSLQPVTREDYVGNKELVRTLEHAIIELFDYDFRKKKNPQIEHGGFQQTYTLWGSGGTGKSTGIALILGEAEEKAKKIGIPFHIRKLDDFKDKYYGESVKNLKAVFDEINRGDAVYAVVLEDIDTVFFARDELKNSPEDKAVLGKLMNLLEGFASPMLGNYVLFATSNHPLCGDGPLMDRLKQGQMQVMGAQNPDEYIAVFQSKLRDGIKNGYVSANNWNDIGTLAKKYELSNRDVRNICLDVMKTTKNHSRPDNYYTMDFDKRSDYLSRNRNAVTGGTIALAIERYAREKAEQAKKDFEESVKSGIERVKVNSEIAKRAKEMGL